MAYLLILQDYRHQTCLFFLESFISLILLAAYNLNLLPGKVYEF